MLSNWMPTVIVAALILTTLVQFLMEVVVASSFLPVSSSMSFSLASYNRLGFPPICSNFVSSSGIDPRKNGEQRCYDIHTVTLYGVAKGKRKKKNSMENSEYFVTIFVVILCNVLLQSFGVFYTFYLLFTYNCV
jgi:hypothetical protein